MPLLKKKYIYAADFAKAPFSDIFSEGKIKTAVTSTADYFANAVLLNNGNLNFTTQALSWQAQLTSYRDAVVVDANNDNLPDIFLAGNYYGNNIHNGRYDADYGTLLINKGKGDFGCENLNEMIIKGELRHIKPIKISNQPAYIAARNNDSAVVIKFSKK